MIDALAEISAVKLLRRVYPGWWMVAVSWFAFFFGVGIIWHSYGVFFVSWERDLGWSRTLISGAFSVSSAMPAVLLPFLGRLVDRYGSRRVMSTGAVLMGLGYLFLSRLHAPWQLFLFYTTATLGFAMLGHVPVATTLARWFIRKRGLAIGLAHTGMGTGGVVLIPVTTLLVTNLGWRPAAAILGLTVWVVLIPLFLLVMRSRPEDVGLLPDNARAQASAPADATVELEGDTVGEAIRSVIFWTLVFAFVVEGIALAGVMSQLIPYLTDLQLSLGMAALAASFAGGMHVVGKIFFGFLADRTSPRYVLSLGFAVGLVGVIGLLLTRNVLTAIGASAILGLGGSVVTVLQPVIVSSFFGNRSLGSILGILFAINTLGFAVGPVMSGRTFDVVGSYQGIFLIYCACIVVAAIIPLLVKPRRRQ